VSEAALAGALAFGAAAFGGMAVRGADRESVLARAGEPHGVENQTDDRLVLLVGMAPPPEHA